MKKNQGYSRRQWLKHVGQTTAAGAVLLSIPSYARPASAQVVVVGGGFGGATAARYIKRRDPSIHVRLIEPAKTFYTCPFSNLYLGGLRRFEQQAHSYDDLRAQGIEIIHDIATAVDPDKKTVQLAQGASLTYDKLLLSPGVDMRWHALEGYDEAAAELAPHAWKAGAQTQLLKNSLMPCPMEGLLS